MKHNSQLLGFSRRFVGSGGIIQPPDLSKSEAIGYKSQSPWGISGRKITPSVKAVPAFTLIEMLVVVAIFSVISLVILANHSRFDSSVLLGSLAYDIALSVREAQVYGLSVQEYASNFQVGYGIHFAGSGSYVFFADTNTNNQYDAGVDSIVQTYALNQGHTIARFCGITSLGVQECSDSLPPIDHLDVDFFRPNPDANISSNLTPQYSSAKITVASPSGETRTITIASTGQISVTNP